MNQLIVSGRVSKEINVKGKVGYLTLANERDYPFNKDQNGNKVNNFLTCKILGEKNIQRVQQYLTKGTAIIVTGHYFRDSWKDGNEYKEFNYILVEKWEFQAGKGTEQVVEQTTDSQSQDDTHTPQSAPDNNYMNIPEGIENDLPFR